MICPGSTDSTPVVAPKTFTNWARALSFTAAQSFHPSTRGEIVKLIRNAEDSGQRVKWSGSLWSFTENFVGNNIFIESDAISGAIPNGLILDRLRLVDSTLHGSIAHIKGGTKVFNVNRILHGLPELRPDTYRGSSDEVNLDCSIGGMALPTLGGSGGQSIAGVMATGSHGGDIHLPPIADCVMAIHLIGPGGQEWWIERSSGFTSDTEAEVQNQLRNIVTTVAGASNEMCEGIIVRKNDDLFRAVLVSVGRMGFVYSLVVKTSSAFKLQESRTNDTWESYKSNLTASMFPVFTSDKYFINVLINPFNNGGVHSCKVAERQRVDCSTPNLNMSAGASSFDFMGFICRQQDVRTFLPLLIVALVALGGVVVGLIALMSGELAAASALAAIPFVGWALAAAMYAIAAATAVAIAGITTAMALLTGLISYMTFAGSLTPGELVAAIANFAYSTGLKDLMKALLALLFDTGYSMTPKTGVSWKIMDTYNYAAEDFCQKVDSMEFAFDVAADDASGHLAFIDEVLMIFDDLFNRNLAVAGILALRYTSNTTALIGMSKFPMTCHIEIPVIRNFGGNAEFINRVQEAAIRHNGVPHWGQLMSGYAAADIARLHGDDLLNWRRRLAELIRGGEGAQRFTFSNAFTQTYNLEPFDDTAISAVRLSITVGDDSLGDTDWLRHDVSADTARVTLRDGTISEISLNEGAQWAAGSMHVRDIPVAPGTMWGDVVSVSIQHSAAGNDWNADNWTMNGVTISSVSTSGDVVDQFSQTDNPVWQFRKNDHQIWQHDFTD